MKNFHIGKYIWICGLALMLCACKKEPTWQDQYDLGMKYLEEGDYEEALTAFSAAIKIEPQQVEAYIGRADTYAQIAAQTSEDGESDTVADKNYELAEADYTKALKLDEENEDAYVKLTDLALTREDFEEAEQLIQTGTEKTGSEKLQEKQDEIRAKDEERLKNLYMERGIRTLREFYYDDYDYDGTYEAFVVTADQYDPEEGYLIYGGVEIWYIDSEGVIAWMGEVECGFTIGIIDTGTQKFINWGRNYGGSGTTSFIYGVRNKVPYEPKISRTGVFIQQESGEILRLERDYYIEGGYEMINHLYEFDESTGEFYDTGKDVEVTYY